MNTSRLIQYILVTVLLLGAKAPRIEAVEPGEIQLFDLPAGAYVYVDGKPLVPQGGVLQVAAGWHEVQVEARQWDGIHATRRLVEVRPGQKRSIFVGPHLLPVIPTGKTVTRRGPIGPFGPPAPVAIGCMPGTPPQRPPASALPPPTLQDAKAEMQGPLYAQIQALLRQVRQSQDRVRNVLHDEREAYWYDPNNQSRFDQEIQQGPVGPMGPAGPMGPVGAWTPQRIVVPVDQAGKPLESTIIEFAAKKLGLPAISQAIAASLERADKMRLKIPAGPESGHHRIAIHTPEFKERLDREKAQALAAGRTMLAGPPGLPGPIGPAGPSMPYPGEGAPIRVEYKLTAAQVQELVDLLTKDEPFTQLVQRLRQQQDDIALWVAEAERRAGLSAPKQ